MVWPPLNAVSPGGSLHPFVLTISCTSLVVGTYRGVCDGLIGFSADRLLRLASRLPSADSRVDWQLKSVTVSTHV